MKNTVLRRLLALRAIGAAYARRLWWQLMPLAVVLVCLPYILLFWLLSLSPWMWLLFIPVSIVTGVTVVISIVYYLVIRRVTPRQTAAQREMVQDIITRLDEIQAFAGIPRLVLIIRLVRSIAAPSQDDYLTNIFARADIRSQFSALEKSFSDY